MRVFNKDFVQLIWGPQAPSLPNAIWAPGCTWNEARNKLLDHVRLQGKHYIYLIFTDDDASLSMRPSSAPEGTMIEQLDDPWREFERLLLKWLPAAGYARYTIQQPQETKKDEPEIECVRCLCVCVCVCVCVYVFVCVCVYIYIYRYICLYVRTYECIYICVCMYIHTYNTYDVYTRI